MATLLQLTQQAMGEMGLAQPTTVVGNNVKEVAQMLALLNAVGYELQREHTWEALSSEYQFTVQYTTITGNLTSGSAVVSGIPSTAGLDTTYMISGTGVNTNTMVSSVDSGTQLTMSQAATATGTAVSLTLGKTKYTLPSDFDRQVDRTHYDKSKKWEMPGPETAQQWQFLKSSYISTGPRIRYRILGGYFQIWPLISASEVLGFEYISKNWARAVTTGAAQSSFTNDGDTCIFPDRLMVLGAKMKYFESKGFDASALTRDFNEHLGIAKANDAGSPTLSFAPRLADVLVNWNNIPDSGYGPQ